MLFAGAIAITLTTIFQIVTEPMHGGSFFLTCGLLFIPAVIASAYWLGSHSSSPSNKVVQFAIFALSVWGLAWHIEINQTDNKRYQETQKRVEYERYSRESDLKDELSRLSPDSRSTVEDLVEENARLRELEKKRN